MAQIEADDLENDLSLDMDVETVVGIVRKAKDGSDIILINLVLKNRFLVKTLNLLQK